jgi:uncharacterized membrane protein
MAIQRPGVAWISVFTGCAAFLTACGSPAGDAPPTAPPRVAAFGKAAGGATPAVNAADPASARQGTVTLDVRITGSGFDAGSHASWQRNGVEYPKIVVNHTTYVSSTTLIANITVASDADAVTYDIAVVAGTGKKGIGAEMFTVTYAVAVPGLTEGRAINDAGQIVGYNGTSVVVFDPVIGAVSVASDALAYDIDRNGRAIVGKDAAGDPVIWTSASGPVGPWVATKLPATGIGTVRAIASDAAGDAVLLSGANFSAAGQRIPTVWSRTVTGWQKTLFTVPAGFAGAWGEDINPLGQVVGMDGSTCCGAFYWDSLGAPTRLAALSGASNASAWAINGNGTIIVGLSGKSAVFWRRTLIAGTYGAWSSAIALDTGGSGCGKNGSSIAYDVNSAGTVVVGESCGVGVAWRQSGIGTVMSRTVLQGLGPPNQSTAWGVNDLASPLATGSAKTSGVRFQGF